MHYIRNYFRGIWENKYVLVNIVRQDLQTRYNRSILGVAWSVITPLGLSIIIGLIYSVIFATDARTLLPYLLAGLNPWNFITGSADGGTRSYLSAEGYIKQTTVAAQIFPLRVVVVGFVNLLYSIIAFFAIYLFFAPNNFNPKMLMVFPGLVIIFWGGVGLANISSVINLYLRDYQPFQSLILQGLFYVTPILFSAEIFAQSGYSIVYKLNPFYYYLEVVRAPMLGNYIPEAQIYFVAVVMTLILMFISIVMVMKTCKSLALKL